MRRYLGWLLLPWWAFVFVVVFYGGSALFTAYVAEPRCVSECSAQRASFERLAMRGRQHFCACSDGSAFDTSLPDLGTGLAALAFLAGCYVPPALIARRLAK